MKSFGQTIGIVLSLSLLGGCNPDVTFFNPSFLNEFSGSQLPIAPGPDAGYVLVMGFNNTDDFSVEFVVTVESEEIIATLDAAGNATRCVSETLDTVTANLLTDVDSPTLAVPFDNSPVEFDRSLPPKGYDSNLDACKDIVNKLIAKDPQAATDRNFVRFVRVLRIGLGRDLGTPSGQDDGIVVRPRDANPDTTSGSIFPSGVNKALSFDSIVNNSLDPADFGNGDLVIFLVTDNSNAVGGFGVSAGVIDGASGSITGSAAFLRDTFEILRREQGPINPLPPS